jgi:hypothetical protein
MTTVAVQWSYVVHAAVHWGIILRLLLLVVPLLLCYVPLVPGCTHDAVHKLFNVCTVVFSEFLEELFSLTKHDSAGLAQGHCGSKRFCEAAVPKVLPSSGSNWPLKTQVPRDSKSHGWHILGFMHPQWRLCKAQTFIFMDMRVKVGLPALASPACILSSVVKLQTQCQQHNFLLFYVLLVYNRQ